MSAGLCLIDWCVFAQIILQVAICKTELNALNILSNDVQVDYAKQQLWLMHQISETPQPHRDHIALTNCKTNANGHSLIPERNVLNLNLSFLKSLHAVIDDYMSTKT